MEFCEIKVDTVNSLTLPYEEVIVIPIGDVQLGAQGVDERRLRRDIEWGMAHNAYFLGMGEYLDLVSPSNRARLAAAGFYDSVMDTLEQAVMEKISDFLSLVRGTEGRWLGMLEGHHLFEFRDGSTSDTIIAEALKTKFLGTCAFVRLKFKRSTVGVACTIWCHHGTGSGVKASAPLNKLENIMPYFDADIYLMGHQHKKVAAVVDRIYMTRKPPHNIGYKTIIMANTGGYMEGYVPHIRQGGLYPRGGYVEKGMRAPVGLGSILLYIRPVRIQTDGMDIARLDLNVGI